MRRLMAMIICLSCVGIGSTNAADGLHFRLLSESPREADQDVVDLHGPVFDYPITRAIGIDVHEILMPPVGPGIDDLATD